MATVTQLETRALARVFGGLRAVDNVDFALPRGGIHAFIGPNGAGKSTFVGLVSGRIPASSGAVLFEGRDISAMPAHRRIRLGIAYTFQITAVYGRLSLADNIALALRSRTPQAIAAALARVGLEERADQLAGNLSYGHQRLLEIAMGVAQRPRLLILDEPTQGLAESEIAQFNALIRELASETTVLLIEHNMDVVMELAHAITVLEAGRILATGTPDEIRASAAVQAAYLGTG
jgi:branched-chain amino acid transport system ATP-binding protein